MCFVNFVVNSDCRVIVNRTSQKFGHLMLISSISAHVALILLFFISDFIPKENLLDNPPTKTTVAQSKQEPIQAYTISKKSLNRHLDLKAKKTLRILNAQKAKEAQEKASRDKIKLDKERANLALKDKAAFDKSLMDTLNRSAINVIEAEMVLTEMASENKKTQQGLIDN